MRDRESIIEEYRKADSEKRLYLFLSFRALRDEFLEIDQSDAAVGCSAKQTKNKCHVCINWGQSLIEALK